MSKPKKKADIFVIDKNGTQKTMIPCPCCRAFFSADELLSYKKRWRGDIIKGFMQVMERNFDVKCPICYTKFTLTEHMKVFDGKYKTVYFSVPKKLK